MDDQRERQKYTDKSIQRTDRQMGVLMDEQADRQMEYVKRTLRVKIKISHFFKIFLSYTQYHIKAKNNNYYNNNFYLLTIIYTS